MIAGVHFHEVDEFLTELERDADDESVLIERAIVRRTTFRRSAVLGGPTAVSVVASYLSTRRGCLPALVHVDAHAGYLGYGDEPDEKTTERRDGMRDAIAAACERLGLELRGGVYEAAPR